MKVLDNSLLILMGLPPRLCVNYLHTVHRSIISASLSRAKWWRIPVSWVG